MTKNLQGPQPTSTSILKLANKKPNKYQTKCTQNLKSMQNSKEVTDELASIYICATHSKTNQKDATEMKSKLGHYFPKGQKKFIF